MSKEKMCEKKNPKIVENPQYVCKKCRATANKKKRLCKAEEIKHAI